MAIIYDISELTSVAGMAGEVVNGNMTLSQSKGTIISGYVEGTAGATVGNVAVEIFQRVGTAATTAIGQCVSNLDGLYMFGIKTVVEGTIYTAEADGYTT